MGVPKFFRYISERYPSLNELVRENQIPEFDNLYLDMNGIIHTCSHPDDSNVHYRISEEKMFKAIFHYIDVLFRIVQPQKLMFMAIDGVAPRAKMNQQRGRRFRTAKECELQEKKAREKGEKLPDEARFDSNCITPGTPFMTRLQKALRFFVKKRISESDIWQKCRVILSGHETPGEGEHKIMEYIRFLKSKPDWDPNTRHCLYGLDADLIMLGLCTHEQHFSLLREEVKFGKNAKHASSVDHTRFYLLHLGLLREYIAMEFGAVRNQLSFPFDIESIVDDWVLMGFLVGNDFIPNLPNLHINKNALPEIYATYKNILPTLDGYLNDSGKLNLARLEKFLEKLGQKDKEFFQDNYDDLRYLGSKGLNGLDDEDTEDYDANLAGFDFQDDDLARLAKETQEMCGITSDSDDDDEEALFEKNFIKYKKNYYVSKLKYPDMTEEVLREQTHCYISALQWTLYYYYRGIVSWGWYYPHHYAPFVSDLRNFANMSIKFDMGRPFLPFEQLLAVLPSASRALLPEAYQGLMTDEMSPISDYYPTEFETDLNGKRQDWEAIVLIPFINEERLLKAMQACYKDLTEEEVLRNSHGPMLQYDYVTENQGPCQGPENEIIHAVFARETLVERSDIFVSPDRMVLKMSEKTLKGVLFPGFPTTNHLKYTSKLEMARVKVFEQPSMNESMIMHLNAKSNNLDQQDIQSLARSLVGKEVFIGWPHMVEAKVTAVSNEATRYGANGVVENHDMRAFRLAVVGLREHNKHRLGIEIGETSKLVHVLPIESRDYVFGSQGVMTLKKLWSKVEQAFPLQAIVKDLTVHNHDFMQFKTVDEVFPIGSTIFLLSTPQYGCRGEVIDTSTVAKNERIRVSLNVFPEPEFPLLITKHKRSTEKYLSCLKAATEIGIQPTVLGQISGTVLVIGGARRNVFNEDNVKKVNVGLLMQSRKANVEIPGYTKKIQGYWYYSRDVVKIVSLYLDRFPRLFSILAERRNGDIFEEDLRPEIADGSILQEMVKFVKEQPHYNMDRQVIGAQVVEKEIIEEMMEIVQESKKNLVYKQLKLQIKPKLVYRPGLMKLGKGPDPDVIFKLFDRVIVATAAYPVPLGLKGTIVSIIPEVDPNPIRFETRKTGGTNLIDVLFDEEFENGQSLYGLGEGRVYRLPDYALINITYGRLKYSSRDQIKEVQQSREFYPKAPFKIQMSEEKKMSPPRKEKLPENQSPNAIRVNGLKNEKPIVANQYNDIWTKLKEQKYPLPPVHMIPTNTQQPYAKDGSDLLRKLLKLDKQPEEVNEKVPEQPTAPAKLPPPPPLWRQEAFATSLAKSSLVETKKDTRRPQSMPQKGSIVHPPAPKGTFQPTLSAFAMHKKPPLIYPAPPFSGAFPCWQMRPNFQQQPLNFWPHARPQGCPMNFMPQAPFAPPTPPSTTVNSHSDFIPLQAARKIVKQKNLQPKETFEQRNAQQRQRVQQNQVENQKKFTAFMASGSVGKVDQEESPVQTQKIKKSQPPTPRQARIAANFNISS
uniref:5'-3' exoribonuclease 1 n=1 Tax=Phlebotomus kandelakii TaxID=1109342 RepID=A0A6B2E5W8_9DIPT